jgi:hypothetical protein
MTTLNRNLSREVPTIVRDGSRVRPIIVELVAGDPSLYLRQKGTRRHYALPYEVAYHLAVKLEVDRCRREKAGQKKLRRRIL